ncbi:hypothetical protein ACH4S8_10800 [Streptomyces sp. NPDC021080]|uniref:hypothetical protein n=1 Tax=Streptomyces sp. NPDC021080 TaxID=3365110 RepID=UPI003795F8C3
MGAELAGVAPVLILLGGVLGILGGRAKRRGTTDVEEYGTTDVEEYGTTDVEEYGAGMPWRTTPGTAAPFPAPTTPDGTNAPGPQRAVLGSADPSRAAS